MVLIRVATFSIKTSNLISDLGNWGISTKV